MERKAWHCPGCGKVHAPHVDTCPEQMASPVSVPTCWPAPVPPWSPYHPTINPSPSVPDTFTPYFVSMSEVETAIGLAGQN